MNKIGLVFAGGGGKGAYQVGVWKALRELGIDRSIACVSGTSVGALNGALFLQGNYETAEKTWYTISPEKILSLKFDNFLDSLQKFNSNIANTALYAYSKKLEGYGMFSRSGMLKLIDQSLQLQTISSSSIPFYATCCQIGQVKPTYFQLNGLSEEKIISILLASSAIPGVFPPEKINGNLHYDGGLPIIGDNVPIAPVYEMGCDFIIVVLLDRSDVLDTTSFSKAKIVEILPSEDQGNFITGTLQFTASGARRRVKQGYDDTIGRLEPFIKRLKADLQLNQTVDRMLVEHQSFTKKHADHNKRLAKKIEDLEMKLNRGHEGEFHYLNRNKKPR